MPAPARPRHDPWGSLMLLWFAGTAVLAVWLVFRDPAFDYRLVIVGALAPEVIDALTGGVWLAHTLAAPVVVLVAVMLGTRGRRPLRKRLLAIPIGMFLHLVFDAAWANTEVFWWPFTGWALPDGPLPSVERGAVTLLLEVAGAAILLWCWHRFGLADRGRRQRFWRTGRLDPAPVR